MSKTAKLMSLLAISTLAISAVASADCFTMSNGLEFTGPTAQDAVYGCQTSPGTNAVECQEAVQCNGAYPVPFQPGYPVYGPGYPVGPYPYPGYGPGYPVPVRPYPGPGYGPGYPVPVRPYPGPGYGPGFGPHPGPGPGFGPHPGPGPGFGPHPGGPGFGPHPHDGADTADNA